MIKYPLNFLLFLKQKTNFSRSFSRKYASKRCWHSTYVNVAQIPMVFTSVHCPREYSLSLSQSAIDLFNFQVSLRLIIKTKQLSSLASKLCPDISVGLPNIFKCPFFSIGRISSSERLGAIRQMFTGIKYGKSSLSNNTVLVWPLWVNITRGLGIFLRGFYHIFFPIISSESRCPPIAIPQ